MAEPKKIRIDPLSAPSLILEFTSSGKPLGSATGFVVEYEGKNYLITNWHVITGRNAETGKPLSPTLMLPDKLHLPCHVDSNLGKWFTKTLDLFGPDGSPVWLEHPKGQEVDVVAVPLDGLSSVIPLAVTFYPLDLKLAESDILPVPGLAVSIIGFPLGMAAAGAFPIWKTGHIASDPDLDYQGKPCFLIDATTRGGMSGAPVVLRTNSFQTKSGDYSIGSTQTLFLGVYSGRIHENIEIGQVWKPHLIKEILAQVPVASVGGVASI